MGDGSFELRSKELEIICEMMELKIVDGFEIYPTKFSSNYGDFFFFW